MVNKILKRALVSALALSVLATSIPLNSVQAATHVGGAGTIAGGGGKADGNPPRSIQGYNLILIGGNKGLDTYKLARNAGGTDDGKNTLRAKKITLGGSTTKYWGGSETRFTFDGSKRSSKVTGVAAQGVSQGLFYLYNSDVGSSTLNVVGGKKGSLGDLTDDYKLYVNTPFNKVKSYGKGNLAFPESQVRSIAKSKDNSNWLGSGLFISDTKSKFPTKASYVAGSEEGLTESKTMKQLGALMHFGNDKKTQNGLTSEKAKTIVTDKLRTKWAAFTDLQAYCIKAGSGYGGATPDLGKMCYRVASMIEVQAEGMKRLNGSAGKSYNNGMEALDYVLSLSYCSDASKYGITSKESMYQALNIPASETKPKDYMDEKNLWNKNPIAKACLDAYGSKKKAANFIWSYSQMPSIVWRYIANCAFNGSINGSMDWAEKHTVKQMLQALSSACIEMTDNECQSGKKKFHLGFGEFNFIVAPVMSQFVASGKLNLINGIAAANKDRATLLGGATHYTWISWIEACKNMTPSGEIKWNNHGDHTGYNLSYVKKLIGDKDEKPVGKKDSWLRPSKVEGGVTELPNSGKLNGFALGFVEPWYKDAPIEEDAYKTVANGSVTNQTVTVHDSLVGGTQASTSSTNIYMNQSNLEVSDATDIANAKGKKNMDGQNPYGLEDSKKYDDEKDKLRTLDDKKDYLTSLAGDEVKNAYENNIKGRKKISSASIGNYNVTNDLIQNYSNSTSTEDAYVNKLNDGALSDYIVADKQSSVNTITSKLASGKKGTALFNKQTNKNWNTTTFNVTNAAESSVTTTGGKNEFAYGQVYTAPKYSNFAGEVISQIVGTKKYLVSGGVYGKASKEVKTKNNDGGYTIKQEEDDYVVDMSKDPTITIGNSSRAGSLAGEWNMSSGLDKESLKAVSNNVSSKYSTVYYAPINANKPDHDKKRDKNTIQKATGWSKQKTDAVVGLSVADSRTAAGVDVNDKKFNKQDKSSEVSNTGVLLQKNQDVYSTYSSFYIEMSEDVASSEGVCWYNGLDKNGNALDSLTEKQVYDISGTNSSVASSNLPTRKNNESTSYVYSLKGGLFKGEAPAPAIYTHKLFSGTTLDGETISNSATTYSEKPSSGKTGTKKQWGNKSTITFTKDNLASKWLQENGKTDADPAMLSNYAIIMQRENNNVKATQDWGAILTKILKSLNTRRTGDFYNTKNIIVGASGASKLEKALSDAGVKGVSVKYLGQGAAESIAETKATVGSKILNADTAVGYDVVTITIKKANLPIVTAIHTNPDEVNHVYADILGNRSVDTYANYTYGSNTGKTKADPEVSYDYIGDDPTISGFVENSNGKAVRTRDGYCYTTIATAPKLSMFNVWTAAQAKQRWIMGADVGAPYKNSTKVDVFRASYYTYNKVNKSTHTKTSTAGYFYNSRLESGASHALRHTYGSGLSGDNVTGGGNISKNASQIKYNGWNNKGMEGTRGGNDAKFDGTLMNDRADSTNPDGNTKYLISAGIIKSGNFALSPCNNFTKGMDNKVVSRVIKVSKYSEGDDRTYIANSSSKLMRVTGAMIFDMSTNNIYSGSASPNNVLVIKKSDKKNEDSQKAHGSVSGSNSAGFGVLQSNADSGNKIADFADTKKSTKPKNDLTNSSVGNSADGLETVYTRGNNGRFRWNAIGENMSGNGTGNQLIAYDAEINEQSILDYMVLCRNYTYQTISTLGLIRTDDSNKSLRSSDNTSLKALKTKSETKSNSYMASRKHSDRFYSINNTNDESKNYFVYSRSTGKYLSYYPEVGMKAYAYTDASGNVVDYNKLGSISYIHYNGNSGTKNITKRMIYTVGEAKRVFEQRSINIISTNVKRGNSYGAITSNDISSATVSDAIADTTDSSNKSIGNDQKQVIYQGANINLNSTFNKNYLLLSNYTVDLPVSKNATTATDNNDKSVLSSGDVTYSGLTAADILGKNSAGVTNNLHELWNSKSTVGIKLGTQNDEDFYEKYFAGAENLKDANGADINGAATDKQFMDWATQVEKAIKPSLTLVAKDGNTVRNVYKNFNKTALKVSLNSKEMTDDINKNNNKAYNSYLIVVKNGKIVTDPNARFSYETGEKLNTTDGTYAVTSDWYQLVTDVAKDMGYDTSHNWTSDSTNFREVAKYIKDDSGMLSNLEKSMVTLSSRVNHSVVKESTIKGGQTILLYNGITGANYNGSVDISQKYEGIGYGDSDTLAATNCYKVKNTAKKWYSENTSVFIVRRSTRRLNLDSVMTQDKLDIGSGPSKVTKNNTLQDIAEDSDDSTGIETTWNAEWYLRLFLSGEKMTDSNNYVLNEATTNNKNTQDTYLIGNKDNNNDADSKTWGIHLKGADFLIPDATTSDMRR